MITRKVAIGIFVCGLAILPFSVCAQNQDDVASLLSRSTAAVKAANPEYRSAFTSGGGVKCVGVIPKSSKTSAGSNGSEGIVTCQTRGEWSSPFIVRAMPKYGNTLGISSKKDEDIVFLTYGESYSSERQLDGMTLKNGQNSQVLSVGGEISRISNSTIGIAADPSNQIPNQWSSSPEAQSFLEGVSNLAHRQSRGPTAAPQPPSRAISDGDKTPFPIDPPVNQVGGSGGTDYMPRVTGTNVLVSGEKETSGYGLYSYALIAHSPNEDELPVYKAFFRALLALPTAEGLVKDKTPLTRINITEVPTTKKADHWDTESPDERVTFVMANYDYARAAGILACLPQRTGPGPVVISVLTPIDVSKHPTPVFVEDLTRAEPEIMTTNVTYFVVQVGQAQFWKESTLNHMRLTLRNQLASSASALRMSHTEVLAWMSRINIQHAK